MASSTQGYDFEQTPGHSEGLMLKLKLQYFCHMMRTDSLGKIEGTRRRGKDGWMASPTQWT